MNMTRTCAWTTTAISVMLLFFHGSPARADDLRLLVPMAVMNNETLQAFNQFYAKETGNTVIMTASPDPGAGSAPGDLALTARQSETNLLFGWAAGDWQKAFANTDLSLALPDNPLFSDIFAEPQNGVAILGAGFSTPIPTDEPTIALTRPVPSIELPLIVAQPLKNSLSSSDRQAQDIADFFRLLKESKVGQHALRSLTLLPNGQSSEGSLRLYVASGTNGCGCDSKVGACDPDGYVLPGFDLAQRSGTSYQLTTGMNGNGGCGCNNGRLVRLEADHPSADRILEAGRMLASKDLDPSSAIYFACDPD